MEKLFPIIYGTTNNPNYLHKFLFTKVLFFPFNPCERVYSSFTQYYIYFILFLVLYLSPYS